MINKTVTHDRNIVKVGLAFPRQDSSTPYIVAFCDASFATNEILSDRVSYPTGGRSWKGMRHLYLVAAISNLLCNMC